MRMAVNHKVGGSSALLLAKISFFRNGFCSNSTAEHEPVDARTRPYLSPARAHVRTKQDDRVFFVGVPEGPLQA